MDHVGEIVKLINGMSGSYAPYNIFSDWIEMAAISVQNLACVHHGKLWQKREQQFANVRARYTDSQYEGMAEMTAYLIEALEADMRDVLGEVYMRGGMGNKYTGQFFTPFHVAEMLAKLECISGQILQTGRLSLTEPSSGGGGMVIAVCRQLRDMGFDYQRRLDVLAQDLDWKGCYMSYLQLSLIGCRALVVQGDTLTEPYSRGRTPEERILRTPAMMGALL